MSDDMHEVVIYDKTAQALAHLFLPPAGTQISAKDLEAACRALAEAAQAWKRLQERGPRR
jgi:hypothetical protein